MIECKWLPPLVIYNPNDGWEKYENTIYAIFCKDFKESYPYFKNKKVKIRFHPIEYGKEEAFFHITCKDYFKDGDRVPDLRRCERIRWPRKFIENYDCNIQCNLCDGIKMWDKPYKNTVRTHLLLEEEKYIVVLEKRKNYYLLITAFYIEQQHQLDKKLKEYDKYKND